MPSAFDAPPSRPESPFRLLGAFLGGIFLAVIALRMFPGTGEVAAVPDGAIVAGADHVPAVDRNLTATGPALREPSPVLASKPAPAVQDPARPLSGTPAVEAPAPATPAPDASGCPQGVARDNDGKCEGAHLAAVQASGPVRVIPLYQPPASTGTGPGGDEAPQSVVGTKPPEPEQGSRDRVAMPETTGSAAPVEPALRAPEPPVAAPDQPAPTPHSTAPAGSPMPAKEGRKRAAADAVPSRSSRSSRSEDRRQRHARPTREDRSNPYRARRDPSSDDELAGEGESGAAMVVRQRLGGRETLVIHRDRLDSAERRLRRMGEEIRRPRQGSYSVIWDDDDD